MHTWKIKHSQKRGGKIAVTMDVILYVCLIIVDVIGLSLFRKKKWKISVTDGLIFFSGIGYGMAHIILKLIQIK